MRPTSKAILRGVVTFLVIAVAAGAAGVGAGLALSKLKGNTGGGASIVPQATRSSSAPTASTPATSTATTTTATTTTTTTNAAGTPIPQGAAVPRVQVVSATLFPAATASGRARRRARVSVHVRVTNRDSTTLTPPNPLLLTGTDRIGVDPRAQKVADALIQPLGPSRTATGELRFEVAGAITQRLTAKPRARLAIVNRIVALTITISPTPAPPG